MEKEYLLNMDFRGERLAWGLPVEGDKERVKRLVRFFNNMTEKIHIEDRPNNNSSVDEVLEVFRTFFGDEMWDISKSKPSDFEFLHNL